jgi:hypothetical protein
MNFLRVKEIPFVLTLMIGLFSWTIVHLVDRISESSIIIWDVEHDDDNTYHIFKFENISSNQLYGQFSIEVYLDGDVSFLSHDLRQPPNINLTNQEPQATSKTYKVSIEKFYPGNSFEISVSVSKPTEPKILFNPPDAGVRIERPSISSFLIKNESAILITSLVCWTLMIVGYVVAMSRSESGSTPQLKANVNDPSTKTT